MYTGLLWFDNSQADLSVKVQKAADYYVKKYGCQPDLCLVNPSMLKDDARIEVTFMFGTLAVRPYRPVLPGHIWIGIEDKE